MYKSYKNDKTSLSGWISDSHRRDSVVVRASASQLVELWFNYPSHVKTLKCCVHSFPAWRLVRKGLCGEQAHKLACYVIRQDT